MAHNADKKAQALAMLALGNTPGYVAKQLGIPLTTCKRWQHEARHLLADALSDKDRAGLQELGEFIEQSWLRFLFL